MKPAWVVVLVMLLLLAADTANSRRKTVTASECQVMLVVPAGASVKLRTTDQVSDGMPRETRAFLDEIDKL